MKNEFNTNNSKKLILGLSIIFCAVILIIGVSFAYLTQSDTKEIDDLVSAEQVTLEYNDSNNNYMLGDLIPINETDVETAYNIYEINNEASNKIKEKQSLTYDDKTPITLFNNLTLNNRSSKTYEIVYYINNNPNANQNIEDEGKKFGAQITVNSITTGEYKSKQIGESCYKVMELGSENTDTTYYSETIDKKYYCTHILTEFYGIDEENKEPVEGCGVTKEGDFYNVTVPSKIGDKEISTLGNGLFMGLNVFDLSYNEKSKIKYIEIENGIEIIEDGDYEDNPAETFFGIGTYFTGKDEVPNYADGDVCWSV